MEFSAKGGSIENIVLDDIDFCGKKITDADRDDPIYFGNRAASFYDQLTIK